MQLIQATQFLVAYVDGGSASMIFQAVIGGLLAAGYVCTTKLGLIKAKLREIAGKTDRSVR